MPDEETVPSRADIPAAAQRAAQQLALAYYEAGLDHGFNLGYDAAEANYEASWAGIPGPAGRHRPAAL